MLSQNEMANICNLASKVLETDCLFEDKMFQKSKAYLDSNLSFKLHSGTNHWKKT